MGSASTASTSKAASVAAPGAATAAPTRVTPLRTRLPSNQALLRTQRPAVQMKVALGPVDDPFEREADAVAERVMRADEPGEQQSAPAQVQRACSSCEKEEDGLGVQRKTAAGVQPGRAEALSHASLTAGGAALPAPVRAFFEPRFGRDLSSVRVHTGSPAEQANRALHAHAFTYAEHIHMGPGQAVAANALLAHELAHVLQQRRLPLLNGAAAKAPATPAGLGVQRLFTPFWEPGDITSGNGNHDIVVPKIGAHNKIFTEAPIPNAKTSKGLGLGKSSDYDVKGRADFYQGSTTIGVYFSGANKAKVLKSDPRTPVLKDGGAFAHATSAAPQVVKGALVNSAAGPTSITLGDLKPSHGTVEALAGPAQLQAYKEGIELAQREAHDPKTPGDGASWGALKIGVFDATTLAIPPEFTYPAFTGQTAKSLVIKKGSSKKYAWIPKVGTIMGKISVKADPGNAGIFNYAWVPDTAIKKADLPYKLQKMPIEVTQRIYDPLLLSPLVKAKKARSDAPPAALRHDAAPVVRRKDTAVAPEKDSFDHEKWKAAHKELTEQFKQESKSPEFKDAEGEIMANQAQEALRSKMGLAIPKVAGSEVAAEGLSKIDFWTGPSALPFGLFRRVFGVAFVKVAQFFVKMRDKVRSFLSGMKAGASIGGGALGGALKAAFRGLKMIAKFVVGRVTDRLMQSLSTGIITKLTALIPPEVNEQLEVQKEKIEAIRISIEKKALDTVDQLLEKAFGVHLADLQKLHEVYQTVQGLTTIVNLVRWGARVIACLSPPGWGCLWILAESLLDAAMQKVAETCWFQKKIQPILAKVEYIRTELPNKLGDAVIAKVKSFLPDSVSDVFADLDKSAVDATDEDIECDEDLDATGYRESPLHQEIEDLYRKIGPERAAALGELAKRMNVPKDRPLTSAELTRLGEQLSKMTPEEIAKAKPADPDQATKTALDDLVKDIEAGTVQAEAPAPAEELPPVSEGEAGQGGADDEAGDEEEGDEPGEGAVKAIEAAQHKTDKKSSTTREGSAIQVVNPAWSHTWGDTVSIHLLIWVDSEARLLVRNAKAKVGHRYWWPKGTKSEAEAAAMVIPYEMLEGIDLEGLDGFIEKGMEVKAYLYTALGREARRIADARAAKP